MARSALSRCSKVCPQNCLLDHLVGDGEQRGRHGEAERLSSLEILVAVLAYVLVALATVAARRDHVFAEAWLEAPF